MDVRTQILFSGFYASQFVLLGVQLPFFSAWLDSRDFSAPEIGWVTGIALAARLAFGPIVAVWADRQHDDRIALRMISFIFAAGALTLFLDPAKWMVAGATAMVLWSFGLLVPLSDGAALRADRAGQLHYGEARAVGSFAFVLTAFLGGLFLTQYGIQWSVAIMGAAGLATFLFSLNLPSTGLGDGAPKTDWRDALDLLRKPLFLLMILSAGLSQGSHAVYYAFSILRWEQIGYSATIIGMLWAVGVIAEIVLLTKVRVLVGRFSPALLIAAAGCGGVIRWTLTAAEPDLPILMLVQLLHALTFAAAYLGAIEFIDRATPKRLVNSAMTLSSTTGVGAIMGLATIAAGYMFDRYGASAAYLMMATMSAMSAVAAFTLHRRWSGGQLA